MKQRTIRAALLGTAVVLLLAGAAFAQWNAALKVYQPSQGQVVFYDSPGCRGEPYMVLRVGQYNDFTRQSASNGNWNDKVSCVDVGPGTKLIVYQHTNYGGSTKSYTPGAYGLCGDWWDNSISSVKIVPF